MPPPFERKWDRRPSGVYRREQMARLRRFLRRQVLPFSPFYRRLFEEAGVDPASLREPEDLARIPFTSKEMIAPSTENPNRPRDLILQPTRELMRRHWPKGRLLALAVEGWLRGAGVVRDRLAKEEYRPVSVFFTTGRTALPTAFVLTRYDLQILEEVGRRIVAVAQINEAEDKILNLFPYAPHLAFWQVYYVGVGSSVFTLNTGGGKVMGTEGILQAIQKVRPAYLVGIPGYVYHVLREAHERSADLSFVKGLALGGDQVTPGYRRRVKEILEMMGARRPRVTSVLGFTEARKCWSECPGEGASGFHTYPDLELIELVDPQTGAPVGPGETGELVYTSLDGRGSCILRYRTGDLVVGGMTHEPCPYCGRTVPRLASQLERVSQHKSFQLSKLKGTLVNLNVLKEEIEQDQRIEEWQLVIKKRGDDPFDIDELHLNLALAPGVPEAEADAVRRQTERRLFEVSEVKVNSIQILPLAKLLELLGMETQLKEKRIIDLRPAAAAAGVGARPEAPVAPVGSE
jgi:phenylacetate-coenzyme A ligase PaaK-like adenylate-forming protein